MDFLKLLKSFEDLLFELLSWIIYYPLTLWRVITTPLAMVRYSNHEQTEAVTDRYTDTLSPPLFLLVTIALLHGVELVLGLPVLTAKTAAARAITASDENLIVARSMLYALLPLFAAWRYVAAKGHPPERKYLRAPFYGQCYLAAVYALGLATSVILIQRGGALPVMIGEIGAVLITLWYLGVQTLQFRSSLGCGTGRAAWLAIRSYFEAVIVFVTAAIVISGIPST
ncbi:hypothetical protein [Polymorphobacter fuscus]|uniref:Permease n=1 Tax=Sandarakinorhabdus fusca TaxID=1439888 RepID=A0A7C9GP74_9SPHN|nr:hypothetical protein [Polymorphobacter fuscus]KAB7646137.1 hypothetical protein F9290_08675 [Polymorphobacter fuscus]MQT17335.1 hypothetical protein [Polymorphobacter fuscus]NJC10132.1 hypothetical protein [Polymorphobacter fuscus]